MGQPTRGYTAAKDKADDRACRDDRTLYSLFQTQLKSGHVDLCDGMGASGSRTPQCVCVRSDRSHFPTIVPTFFARASTPHLGALVSPDSQKYAVWRVEIAGKARVRVMHTKYSRLCRTALDGRSVAAGQMYVCMLTNCCSRLEARRSPSPCGYRYATIDHRSPASSNIIDTMFSTARCGIAASSAARTAAHTRTLFSFRTTMPGGSVYSTCALCLHMSTTYLLTLRRGYVTGAARASVNRCTASRTFPGTTTPLTGRLGNVHTNKTAGVASTCSYPREAWCG